MKKINHLLMSLILITVFLIPNYSSAQGFLITKTGDTIQYTKIESKYPNTKYWTSGSDKAKKIKLTDISNSFSLPEYKLTKNEIDEFTGDLKRYTKFISIGGTKRDKTNYSINLVAWMGKIVSSDKKTYVIKMRTPSELGCSGSDKNYAMIKFMDNEVIKLDNDIAKIDCSKNAVSVFLLTDDILNKLRYNKIKSVRFRQSEYYADYDVIFPDCLIRTIEILDE
jgi:hypothetical protein